METNLYSPSLPPTELLPYCGDLQDWPERWMGEEKDLPAGRRIVECFTPFLLHLAASGLSPTTIQKHVDNLDRKSTRLNSSHLVISYAVFCLKKQQTRTTQENNHNTSS